MITVAGVLALTAVVLFVIAAIPNGRWKGGVRWELLAFACLVIAVFLVGGAGIAD